MKAWTSKMTWSALTRRGVTVEMFERWRKLGLAMEVCERRRRGVGKRRVTQRFRYRVRAPFRTAQDVADLEAQVRAVQQLGGAMPPDTFEIHVDPSGKDGAHRTLTEAFAAMPIVGAAPVRILLSSGEHEL